MGVWDEMERFSGNMVHEDVEIMKEALQESRLVGYCDATSDLSIDLQGLEHNDLETLRLDSLHMKKDVYNDIRSTISRCMTLIELFLILKKVNWVLLAVCIAMAVNMHNLWILLVPIVTVVAVRIIDRSWKIIMSDRLTKQYYNHGYLEAIENLADHKGRYIKDIRISQPL